MMKAAVAAGLFVVTRSQMRRSRLHFGLLWRGSLHTFGPASARAAASASTDW